MNLTTTDPSIDDYKAFYNLLCEPDWQNQFINFRGMTLNDAKKYLEYWILNREQLYPQFFRLIKLTHETELVTFNELNSTTIGYISLQKAGPADRHYSGKTHLINFAIGKKYYGYKLMTNALAMTMESLYELGYNHISAFVKDNNPASERVLIKCGFKFDCSKGSGKTYIRSFDK